MLPLGLVGLLPLQLQFEGSKPKVERKPKRSTIFLCAVLSSPPVENKGHFGRNFAQPIVTHIAWHHIACHFDVQELVLPEIVTLCSQPFNAKMRVVVPVHAKTTKSSSFGYASSSQAHQHTTSSQGSPSPLPQRGGGPPNLLSFCQWSQMGSWHFWPCFTEASDSIAVRHHR